MFAINKHRKISRFGRSSFFLEVFGSERKPESRKDSNFKEGKILLLPENFSYK